MDNHSQNDDTTQPTNSLSPVNSILHYRLIDHIGSGGMGDGCFDLI